MRGERGWIPEEKVYTRRGEIVSTGRAEILYISEEEETVYTRGGEIVYIGGGDSLYQKR